MILLAISVAILVFLLTLIIMQSEIRRQRVKKQQLNTITNKTSIWDDELSKNFWDRIIVPFMKDLRRRLAAKAKTRQPKKQKKNRQVASKLDESLQQAGLNLTTTEFMFIRVAAILGFLFIGSILAGLISDDSAIQFLVILFAFTIGVAGPIFGLRAKVNSRLLAMQHQMPNVMDILSVSIEAGLGFDAALGKVLERFDGPLIDELFIVSREVQMGIARRDSLRAVAKRTNMQELQTFATAIIQSEQYGTPMKNVLRQQSEQLRLSRKQIAQEKGMKAPVRILLPMVLLIFPVIFIILLGPTIITTIAQFR